MANRKRDGQQSSGRFRFESIEKRTAGEFEKKRTAVRDAEMKDNDLERCLSVRTWRRLTMEGSSSPFCVSFVPSGGLVSELALRKPFPPDTTNTNASNKAQTLRP